MKKSLYVLAKSDQKGPGVSTLKGILWALSFVYAGLLGLRQFLYKIGFLRSARLSRPVISVGNITTGGAGKTPFVAYLAQYLMDRNKKPAVLLRGYMDQKESHSDEAQWYKEFVPGVPVLVGPDRAFEAKRFLNTDSCDVFIMDDGFQHVAVMRELNIVMVDASDPWGGGQLIPRGFLREPVTSLKRADVVILSKVDQAKQPLELIEAKVMQANPKMILAHSVHEPKTLFNVLTRAELPLEILAGKRVVAFCSIASGESFNNSLKQINARLLDSLHFIDHHVYSSRDIKNIINAAQNRQAEYIVTTEKDAVKLEEFLPKFPASVKLFVLRVGISIRKNKDGLLKRVDNLL